MMDRRPIRLDLSRGSSIRFRWVQKDMKRKGQFPLAYCVPTVLLCLIAFSTSADLSLQITPQLYPSFAPMAGGGGDAGSPVISADGRYVLFASTANNLALATSNAPIPILAPASVDVYLRDRASDTTTLISVNLSSTGGGNGDSLPIGISTNGRFALFESAASDLVASDTNAVNDVFVRDVISNVTYLVSANTNGVTGNGVSRSSAMTPDGRFVAFVSGATDLVAGDTNGILDVFVRDLVSNVTTLVSVGATSTNANAPGYSESPAISADGRYVAFLSTATNLVPALKASGDIYVRDLISQSTVWASTNARVIAKAATGSSNIFCCSLSLSADAGYIAFEVVSNSSAAYATKAIILRHNLQSGVTDVAATNANVSPGSFDAIRSLEMTGDGRFIAFIGNVGNTSPLTNTAVYLWDAQTGTNILVSADRTTGLAANGICSSPVVSADGRYVAFVSSGTNFATNVLSGEYHVYLRDTLTGTTSLADAAPNGTGVGVYGTVFPSLTADGQAVAFETFQPGLVPSDNNSRDDVFVFAPGLTGTELISVNNSALPGSGPTISWPTNSAQNYQVQFKSDVGDTNWQDSVGSITVIGKRGYFTDPSPASAQKYYRLMTY
jgi:Tol biopolymer transport system component